MKFEFCDNKPCYINEKGFKVHIFEHGTYVCNCGEKKGKPMSIGFLKQDRKKKKKKKNA